MVVLTSGLYKVRDPIEYSLFRESGTKEFIGVDNEEQEQTVVSFIVSTVGCIYPNYM